jgi:uncharacterized membrane protein
MADNGDATSKRNARRRPDDPEEVADAAFRLDFELARLESYYSYESAFYTTTKNIFTAISLLAGTSSVAAATGYFSGSLDVISAVATILTVIAYVFDFKEQARFFTEKKGQYGKWRAELLAHTDDRKWIDEATKTMHEDWGATSGKYNVHFAIEALSWNDAYYKTCGPANVSTSNLYDVWWSERALGHFVRFSREHFANRKRATREYAFNARLAFSIALLIASVGFIAAGGFLLYWALENGTALSASAIAGVVLSLVAFTLFDAGFHKMLRAVASRQPSHA